MAAVVLMLICGSLQAQTLPWQGQGAKLEGKPGQLSPREMLSKLGVDNSHWDLLIDGRPLASEESETQTKLLFRMPRFDPPQWDRWASTPAPLEALVTDPKAHRANAYIVRGRAKKVERIELLKDLIPLYQFKHFYRVTMAAEGFPHPIVIETRAIPTLWKEATDIDEPVSAQAIFLKAGETVDDQTPLYFVGARLAWYPDKENPTLGVDADLVWLAQRGMDIALWDDVRQNNGAGIRPEEGECFYHLLARLASATSADLKQLDASPFDLPTMLQRPDELLGQAFTFTGTARRVQKVMVPESYRERLKLDHYYEINAFVPLDNQVIRLATEKGAKEAPTFVDGFPVTINVVRLPPELEPGRNVHYPIRLKGVFFKLWAYQSEFVKSHSKNQRQPSPLLFAASTQLLPAETGPSWGPWMTTILMFAIIGSVLVVWALSWSALRGDKKFERQVLRKYTHGASEAPNKFVAPSDGIAPKDDKGESQAPAE